MNLALHSRYCLWEQPPETKRIRWKAQHNPSGTCPWGWHFMSFSAWSRQLIAPNWDRVTTALRFLLLKFHLKNKNWVSFMLLVGQHWHVYEQKSRKRTSLLSLSFLLKHCTIADSDGWRERAREWERVGERERVRKLRAVSALSYT